MASVDETKMTQNSGRKKIISTCHIILSSIFFSKRFMIALEVKICHSEKGKYVKKKVCDRKLSM